MIQKESCVWVLKQVIKQNSAMKEKTKIGRTVYQKSSKTTTPTGMWGFKMMKLYLQESIDKGNIMCIYKQ